jgi:hypothetical protein
MQDVLTLLCSKECLLLCFKIFFNLAANVKGEGLESF